MVKPKWNRKRQGQAGSDWSKMVQHKRKCETLSLVKSFGPLYIQFELEVGHQVGQVDLFACTWEPLSGSHLTLSCCLNCLSSSSELNVKSR